MPTYKKAPAWMGKDLTINVGRADMRILDGVAYTDPRLVKFVGMGFLVEVKEPVAKAPAVVRSPAPAPAPAPTPASASTPAQEPVEGTQREPSEESEEGAPKSRKGGRRPRRDSDE